MSPPYSALWTWSLAKSTADLLAVTRAWQRLTTKPRFVAFAVRNFYKCPLCGSALTAHHYHKVMKLQEKREKVQKGELDKVKKQVAAAREATAAIKKKAKQKIEAAKKQAAARERNKSLIRNKRLSARIRKLEEENKMLQKHTSPQEVGLADEGELAKKLKKEFPEDRIEHVGKGGDILQYVIFNKEEVGCIVYECKHTDRISPGHSRSNVTR